MSSIPPRPAVIRPVPLPNMTPLRLLLAALALTLAVAHPSLRPAARQPTNEICPIVLPQDPPVLSRQLRHLFATYTTLARVDDVPADTPRPAPRIVNGNFASPSLQRSLAVVWNGSGHCSSTVLSAS